MRAFAAGHSAAARLALVVWVLASPVGGQPAAAPPGETLAEAERLLAGGRYAEAVARLEGRAAELGGAGEALLGRALALERRYLAAEGPLRRAVAAGHGDLATLFYLGSTLWENGKTEEAAEVYRSALDSSDRHPAILQQLGRLALWSGDHAAAAEYLAEARRQAPESLDLAFDLGRALEGAGRAEEALPLFRRVVERQPDHLQARYSLGRLLVNQGRSEEGWRQLELYRDLHRKEQDETRAAGRLEAELAEGVQLLHSGDTAAAIEHLSGLAPTPDSLEVLARALTAAGRLDEALRALERAVALAPQRGDLRARLTEARLVGARPNGE